MNASNLTRDEAAARAALIRNVAYEIDLDLTGTEDDTFTSTVRITFDANDPSAETFLDLAARRVDSVVVNGTAVEDAYADGRIRLTSLADHNVVSYTYWSSKDEWEFTGPGGKKDVVRTRPRLHANSGDTCIAAALQDQGIVMQPDFLVHDALRDGRLVPLLEGYRTTELGVYAIYTSRRQLPLKLRFLIDFLVDAFQNPAWRSEE